MSIFTYTSGPSWKPAVWNRCVVPGGLAKGALCSTQPGIAVRAAVRCCVCSCAQGKPILNTIYSLASCRISSVSIISVLHGCSPSVDSWQVSTRQQHGQGELTGRQTQNLGDSSLNIVVNNAGQLGDLVPLADTDPTAWWTTVRALAAQLCLNNRATLHHPASDIQDALIWIML